VVLGVQSDAPHGALYRDPALPEWLPDLTIRDLRVGRQRFDIKFWREGGASRSKVLAGPVEAVCYRSIAAGCEL
jgi:hypothetical protein